MSLAVRGRAFARKIVERFKNRDTVLVGTCRKPIADIERTLASGRGHGEAIADTTSVMQKLALLKKMSFTGRANLLKSVDGLSGIFLLGSLELSGNLWLASQVRRIAHRYCYGYMYFDELKVPRGELSCRMDDVKLAGIPAEERYYSRAARIAINILVDPFVDRVSVDLRPKRVTSVRVNCRRMSIEEAEAALEKRNLNSVMSMNFNGMLNLLYSIDFNAQVGLLSVLDGLTAIFLLDVLEKQGERGLATSIRLAAEKYEGGSFSYV